MTQNRLKWILKTTFEKMTFWKFWPPPLLKMTNVIFFFNEGFPNSHLYFVLQQLFERRGRFRILIMNVKKCENIYLVLSCHHSFSHSLNLLAQVPRRKICIRSLILVSRRWGIGIKGSHSTTKMLKVKCKLYITYFENCQAQVQVRVPYPNSPKVLTKSENPQKPNSLDWG